jgi:uncharacterized protein YndB with AHSA1/START domain
MPEIQHLIKIRAAEDKAYQALSNAEGIQNWWTRDATLNSQVGGAGEFGFYDHRMVITVKVTELVPTSRVAWGNVSSTRSFRRYDYQLRPDVRSGRSLAAVFPSRLQGLW